MRVCAHVPFVLPAMRGGMYLKVEGRYMRLQRGDIGPLVALIPKANMTLSTMNSLSCQEFVSYNIISRNSDYCCIRFSCIYDCKKNTFKLVTL